MPTDGQPYPYDIWLRVSLTGIAREKQLKIARALQRLRGWNSGFTGSSDANSLSLRYHYAPNRDVRVVQRARTILRAAGISKQPMCTCVVWRVDFNLHGTVEAERYARMIGRLDDLSDVLTTSMGSASDRSTVAAEFLNEPSTVLMEQIYAIIVSYKVR